LRYDQQLEQLLTIKQSEIGAMPEKQGHTYGTMESVKFAHRRKDFHSYVNFLENEPGVIEDLIYHPTTFMGHMTLNRLLTHYELYKKVSNIAGHIADVGVYKGGSSFLFSKFIKNFESEAHTLCHGFDWFEGQVNSSKDSQLTKTGGYLSDGDKLERLSKLQGLDNILKLHRLDLRRNVPDFFETYPHLRFKLINLDCGKYDVVHACLPHFWAKLNKGGVMIFDQYAHELAPGETLAIHEHLPDVELKTLKNSWMPTAYAIK
jgi:hypothetical protein